MVSEVVFSNITGKYFVRQKGKITQENLAQRQAAEAEAQRKNLQLEQQSQERAKRNVQQIRRAAELTGTSPEQIAEQFSPSIQRQFKQVKEQEAKRIDTSKLPIVEKKPVETEEVKKTSVVLKTETKPQTQDQEFRERAKRSAISTPSQNIPVSFRERFPNRLEPPKEILITSQEPSQRTETTRTASRGTEEKFRAIEQRFQEAERKLQKDVSEGEDAFNVFTRKSKELGEGVGTAIETTFPGFVGKTVGKTTKSIGRTLEDFRRTATTVKISAQEASKLGIAAPSVFAAGGKAISESTKKFAERLKRGDIEAQTDVAALALEIGLTAGATKAASKGARSLGSRTSKLIGTAEKVKVPKGQERLVKQNIFTKAQSQFKKTTASLEKDLKKGFKRSVPDTGGFKFEKIGTGGKIKIKTALFEIEGEGKTATKSIIGDIIEKDAKASKNVMNIQAPKTYGSSGQKLQQVLKESTSKLKSSADDVFKKAEKNISKTSKPIISKATKKATKAAFKFVAVKKIGNISKSTQTTKKSQIQIFKQDQIKKTITDTKQTEQSKQLEDEIKKQKENIKKTQTPKSISVFATSQIEQSKQKTTTDKLKIKPLITGLAAGATFFKTRRTAATGSGSLGGISGFRGRGSKAFIRGSTTNPFLTETQVSQNLKKTFGITTKSKKKTEKKKTKGLARKKARQKRGLMF